MRIIPVGFLAERAVSQINTSVLNFVGPNGSTTFTDETGKIWTPSGNVQLSTSDLMPSGGPSVAVFDGAGDYISTVDSDDWHFSDTPFSIQFFYKRATAGGDHFILSHISGSPPNKFVGIQVLVGTTGLYVAGFNNAQGIVLYPSAVIDTNFHHYEVSQDATTLYVFQDGLLLGSRAKINFGNANARVNIGVDFNLTSGFANGRLAGFKATKGRAGHTSNFTPPPWPFLND